MRYPARYVLPEGRQIIWGSFDVSEMHERMISEEFFNYVGFTQRQMRYKNRRGLDPQVKLFLDQEKIEISPAWNLPVPNEAAAYISLAKYGKAETILSEELVDKMNLAWNWTKRHFMPYMGNSRVVTLQEAVDKLDMSSSSGFPFNREFPTKRELFEGDPEIMDWLEEDWKRLAEDPLWTTIYSSALKEELRPKEKIESNSQRTFTAGASDATVQGNRLFVDQNEKMYAAHLVSSSAIGMSPLKGNWDKLHRKLNIFPNGYALDETQYDSSLRKYMMWACAQFRWEALAPEFRTPANYNRIRTYYRNLIDTLILTPEGILVMKKLGMPSGCVSTVSDNTLILYTFLGFAWICTCPQDFLSYECFEDHTSKALVGDDNTWTVSDEAHVFFNAVSVIEAWKPVGIIATTDSLIARPADELDFLSAHTVFIKGIAVPIYSRDKLMTALLFAPQTHITPATSLQRCTNLLQIGWTDVIYRNFCRAFIQWLLQEYDSVLKDDPRWIVAKAGIMSDEVYFSLFTNRKIMYYPQSYQEREERLSKPDNVGFTCVMSSTPMTKKQFKRSLRNKQRKQSQKVGNVTVKKLQPARRRPKRRGAGRNLGARRNPIARNAQYDSSSKFMGGAVVRNSKRISQPEPFSGDELVASLNGSIAFATNSFVLNPGNATTFPWFSRIATLYERYKFTELEFYFQHDVSQFAAQGAQGLVILSALYDAASAAPTTKIQIEATDPHVICMPNENAILSLANRGMHPVGEPKFVRSGGVPGATDIKTYDAGTLYATTQGMAGATEVGELHVRYRGLLYDRILDSSAAVAPANFSVAEFGANTQTVTTATPAVVLFANSVNNGLLAVNNAGTFTLPAGNYLIDCGMDVADTAAEAFQGAMSCVKTGVAHSGVPAFKNASAAGDGATQRVSWAGSWFLTMSSVDTLAMSVTLTGAAGTLTVDSGYLRIVAI